jgi:hypothetical protein
MDKEELKKKLTVLGEEVEIYFESDEPFKPDINMDFAVFFKKDGKVLQKILNENLTVQKTPIRNPSPTSKKFAFLAKWKVNLQKDKELEEQFVEVAFQARGRSEQTNKIISAIAKNNNIIVAGIDITTDPKLTRIMLHEFATPGGRSAAFDPNPVRGYINTLTAQQKKLLYHHAIDKPEGRLIVFITLYPRKSLRMFADCFENGVIPNATFSVFFCRDVTKGGVTLVCHTEHFVLNVFNGSTLQWITKKTYDGKKPNEWLNKNNPKPVQFKVACVKPQGFCDGVMWNCFYEAATGQNIMPGNSLHGMINTHGCWMLFRNFNWPQSVAGKFYPLYRKRRFALVAGNQEKIVAAELAPEYDVTSPPAGFSTSLRKFFNFDRNFAYQWFFHEIVGIKYFSDTDAWNKKNTANDFLTHGQVLEKQFPLAEGQKTPVGNLPEEGSLAYHNFDFPKLPIDNTLWRQNALGIKAASDFVPDLKTNQTPGQLESRAWADVYFYKEDNLNAEKLSRDDVLEP